MLNQPSPDAEKSDGLVSVGKSDAPEGMFSGLIAKARSGGGIDPEVGNTKTRGGARIVRNAEVETFSTVVIAVLSLGITALSLPPEIKPNDTEINSFSVPLTRILIRHLPISGRMSADVIDIIALITVGTGWYARVMPFIGTAKTEKKISIEKKNGSKPDEPIDPLKEIAAGLKGEQQ
jgi:hypothetical protein